MANLTIKYVKLRPQPDGTARPRSAHGPRERFLGFADADLKNPDGTWFTREQAFAWSVAHAAEILAARRDGQRPRAMPLTRKGESVRDLLEDFQRSRRFNLPRAEGGYSDKGKADYRAKIAAMMWKPGSKREQLEPFMLARAAAITPAEITNDDRDGFYDYLTRARGRAMARGCIMVLSAAYKWGRIAKAWRLTDNPCTRLGLGSPNVSLIEWMPAEIAALVELGDREDPGVADAVVLGLWSGGQREDDVLSITGAHQVDVELPDGATVPAIRLVQSKRQKHVEVLALPPLVARLEAIAKRREQAGHDCAELVVDSHTGAGFVQSTFQHRLRALRKRVAEEKPELGAIVDKPFKALRRTFLSWMKRAGARDDQFAAVSGHSLKSLPQVMPHYYAPGAEQAREAMALVWTWAQRKGIV